MRLYFADYFGYSEVQYDISNVRKITYKAKASASNSTDYGTNQARYGSFSITCAKLEG